MSAIKFDIPKFDGVINFSRWLVRMNAILTQAGLKKALLGKEKKPSDMKDDAWVEMDERALTAIQLCLADEVLDEFSSEKTAAALWTKLQDHYLKKSLANRLILKQRLFLLRMQEGTPIKSHIAEFTSIINELDKIEVVVEDEDQALLLLCSLPSSYQSFREAIIYGGKATVKVKEVKEHLLNKDKIDKQLTGESQQDGSSSALYAGKKISDGSSTSNQKHKNLVCNWCHKKGHIKVNCWVWKKTLNSNNQDSSANLARGDEDGGEVLSVTNNLVGNKRRWIIDSGCSQHICTDREMFTSYTSVRGGVVYMANSSRSKVVGKGSIQFRSHDGYVTTLHGVSHVPGSRCNLISLGTLHREGFLFRSNCGLMEISKMARVTFAAKLVGNVYELQGSWVTSGGVQISSASKSEVEKQSSCVSDSVRVDPEGERSGRCGHDASDSPARCSDVRAMSHGSRLDKGDRWVIKFRLGLNLFDLTKL